MSKMILETIYVILSIVANAYAGHLPLLPAAAPLAYSAYPYSLPSLPAAYSAYPAYQFRAVAPVGPAVLPAAPIARAAPFVAAPALPPPPSIARAAPLIAAPAVPAPAVFPAPFVRTAFPAGVPPAVPVVRGAPVAAPLAAAPVPVAAPLAAAPVVAPVAKLDYADAYPQYQYAYNIQDVLTGDSKAQEETREGGVVKGRYSLIEADGSRRTVNYYADPLNGFNAVVQKDVPVVAAPAAVAV